jgi:hypothetical protein
MPKKVAIKAEIRLKAYPVIQRAIETGTRLGWRRAHKHTDTPTEEAVFDAIETAIMNELDEVLDFGG